MSIVIRQLTPSDAAALVALRRRALLDTPLAFLASPEDDLARSEDAVREQLQRGPDSVVFGAFDDDLVGMLGLFREPHVKAAHKAYAWGMFVAPERRRRGIGARLLAAVIEHARTLGGVEWVQLSVSESTPDARRVYERAGFEIWGVEPDALRHEGRSAGECHLTLRLERRPGDERVAPRS